MAADFTTQAYFLLAASYGPSVDKFVAECDCRDVYLNKAAHGSFSDHDVPVGYSQFFSPPPSLSSPLNLLELPRGRRQPSAVLLEEGEARGGCLVSVGAQGFSAVELDAPGLSLSYVDLFFSEFDCFDLKRAREAGALFSYCRAMQLDTLVEFAGVSHWTKTAQNYLEHVCFNSEVDEAKAFEIDSECALLNRVL